MGRFITSREHVQATLPALTESLVRVGGNIMSVKAEYFVTELRWEVIVTLVAKDGKEVELREDYEIYPSDELITHVALVS